MIVVTTKLINPPPIPHKTTLLPALKAIILNQIAVAAATGQGIKPIKLLCSIFLRH